MWEDFKRFTLEGRLTLEGAMFLAGVVGLAVALAGLFIGGC